MSVSVHETWKKEDNHICLLPSIKEHPLVSIMHGFKTCCMSNFAVVTKATLVSPDILQQTYKPQRHLSFLFPYSTQLLAGHLLLHCNYTSGKRTSIWADSGVMTHRPPGPFSLSLIGRQRQEEEGLPLKCNFQVFLLCCTVSRFLTGRIIAERPERETF